jgi:hypothetical protein
MLPQSVGWKSFRRPSIATAWRALLTNEDNDVSWNWYFLLIQLSKR